MADGATIGGFDRLKLSGYDFDRENTGCGLAMLKDLPDATAALCVFDPQYRGVLDHLKFGNEGARQKGRASLAQMSEEMIVDFIREIERVLQPSGQLLLWVDKYHLCRGVGSWLDGTQLDLVDMITWDKGRIGQGFRSRRQCEYLVIIQKLPKRAKGVWVDRGIRDVITEQVPGARSGHPHKKPIGMMTRLIAGITKPGDLIVDPAAGSFSTFEACKQAGDRRFLGTDLAGPFPAA